MKLRCLPKAALFAGMILMVHSSIALAHAPACRSPSDVLYSVRRDDTLSEIVARFYCVTEHPTITRVWEAVYDHNRVVAGPNPHAVPIDTVLCLPAHVDGTGWEANRCIERETLTPTSSVAKCGNDQREGTEVCDGADLGAMTCTMLGLLAGKLSCRADCAAFDSSGCDRAASETVRDAETAEQQEMALRGGVVGVRPLRETGDLDSVLGRKLRPVLRRLSAELTGGVAIPLSGATWNHHYRLVAITGVGARMTLGWIEIAPRALFLWGQHGTIYNCPSMLEIESCPEETQQIIGGGVAVQTGVPIHIGTIGITPGVEVGWLYVSRSIELTEYPWQGTKEKQSGHLPLIGVFVRSEYKIPQFPNISIAIEIGSTLLPVSLTNESAAANVNIKTLGALGYAF